ncbi:hypothetical protein [uncultured Microbulbifer sp.]|uniref:hypothetical protein n=1 Tax=uncultured Microbulbifer sp. TaxID=348147 RepID=UPI00260DB46F|nr:hypothetical protein [uncultured Microbulbifer sp.]
MKIKNLSLFLIVLTFFVCLSSKGAALTENHPDTDFIYISGEKYTLNSESFHKQYNLTKGFEKSDFFRMLPIFLLWGI